MATHSTLKIFVCFEIHRNPVYAPLISTGLSIQLQLAKLVGSGKNLNYVSNRALLQLHHSF